MKLFRFAIEDAGFVGQSRFGGGNQAKKVFSSLRFLTQRPMVFRKSFLDTPSFASQ